ncbi:MAG: KpsF/GutQ family sugar-phosphate isomerase [Confluentimicrobium sp.]|jgi:arabinose-5-phosphate isomerase|uniref:Arabinose-5-phosphate isomerase n=1 Tax=Actibacterium naphthalenivorans TaxID=1614693 RepID=A0A840CE31_9RHOB|nr:MULTISPECIES: KpsF/GutQ family sugar-phosphate isomerase [Actibacterium]KGB83688.1 D-arabinose 5-phosphate [Rhodovulum sp. NI22]MDY6860973.1 KpsF/GutQ family sugar-phosphate isomerase [Pseudomonadota bacterium]ALG88925.1 D-arabinose 5-phosphate [Actibacterium sp. EMB200-NS6]MBB4021549.1 arabinose-5-phosphate isomerase [Actibacterium naphthalenivorans]MBC57010.1 KpsF/GutQ family sugar-phosphate isomerase [Actibacterium sp.]
MNKETFLLTGRRVIAREAQALTLLADALDESFAEAVALILGAQGRVIVSGMGKSGHIARKIAATFASTGTPAHFVHPAEASHGDLGMLARGDVALVLSNSGETPELADIVAYTRRFSIPMIGVAGRAGSTLLRESDVALLLPPAPEACDTGIVPTTSTTMTLALGDALAIALMEHRQFTPEHFRAFHPGGKLGAQLSKVRDLMHGPDELPTVVTGTPMSGALLTMSQKTFGVVGVTDENGRLIGIVTDGDLRRHMQGLLDLTADQVMTENPLTIAPDALAEEALAVMNGRKVTCLFVVAPGGDGRAEGILHIHDCLRAGVA